MNPGVSDASTGVLFQRVMAAYDVDASRGAVPIHGTTSTSGMIGAGLKKCKPITRAGCRHALAMDATDNEDVFVASTVSAGTKSSRRLNSACFTSAASTIASITSPHDSNTERSSPSESFRKSMRPRSASASLREMRFLSTSRSNALSMDLLAFAVASGDASPRTTRWPAAAATWAMPAPMAPAPTTPTTISSPSTMSASRERWLSLLEEGVHAFAIVVGLSRFALQRFFDVELRIQINAQRLIESTFDEPKRMGRLCREHSGRLGCGHEKRIGLSHLVDEAPAARLLGRHLFREHRHYGRAVQ